MKHNRLYYIFVGVDYRSIPHIIKAPKSYIKWEEKSGDNYWLEAFEILKNKPGLYRVTLKFTQSDPTRYGEVQIINYKKRDIIP